jgi:hypothetical protein
MAGIRVAVAEVVNREEGRDGRAAEVERESGAGKEE